ncbi:MAG: transcriptional regulator, partial [Oscillospiraceae bacterium]|nr:transcriptional regulator [Oscillospiraceae bacterium]
KDMATPSEISEALCVSSARVTAALNSLERKGYITRRIDGADRRRVLIALTPSGRAEAERVRGTLLDILEKMLRSLGEYDAKEYVRITGRMAELALSEASL